jgi:SPP1 family phage portal protein
MLYFIRYYENEDILTGKKTTIVEVYTRNDVITYKRDFAASSLTLVSTMPHTWKLVPVIDYYNNKESLGDFEPVITEIDAYDVLESDSLNEMDYFADAYLGLYGMNGTDAEDIALMKNQRVLLMPSDGKAEWIVKNPSDTYIENMKNRLDASIHKFSKCPAMTDAEFASNASGVAMKYKLMGLENATSKKERAFKKGLQRRLELICNMLAVMGNSYDYRAIDISFTRNIPANLVEMAQVVN